MNRHLIFLLILSIFFSPTHLLAKRKNKAPAPIDHAGIITELNEKSWQRGKKIYDGLCINCHGSDGKIAPVPAARAFGAHPFKFGNDLYSMYQTLTKGNGMMGPMPHLSPVERYEVAHYIREQFVKPMNNGYTHISDDYLDGLPKGTSRGNTAIIERDYGPALASQLGRDTTSAMTVKLGTLTISYDLHSMDQAALWTGGFLNLSNTQHQKLRGGGVAEMAGLLLDGLQGWRWGHGGKLDYPKANLLPRGPLPVSMFDYKGHYLYGNRVLFDYEIDGRSITEMPEEVPSSQIIKHTLKIGKGKALVLAVARARHDDKASTSITQDKVLVQSSSGDFIASTAISASKDHLKDLRWEMNEHADLVLHIPADDKARQITIVRGLGHGEAGKNHFFEVTDALAKSPTPDLSTFMNGGPPRWHKPLITKGEVGTDQAHAGYALDTITLPESNPWQAWFRTSCLDFFSDGRMAVGTHGGDVWIVSGIDNKLKKLSWRRYAAGLYEVFGLRIVDDVIYVTCKDRLIRLHDLNNDGEADHFECFSSDQDVSANFHAFNFDLQTDKKGNFYYAKSGQYTDYALPGSVIKVGPDGGPGEVYATGFRTPNGMGITPDGRLTVSDNEGNWMPSSKVSLIKEGGFYGYVQTKAKPPDWAPDGGKIDHTKVIPPDSFDQPLFWLPRPVDNSSGGQLWVEDKRFGPLSGRLLHTSFGQGRLYYVLKQDVGDQSQAAVVRLPLDFITGVMRARVNPVDGQVYATGLNGWNGGGRKGLGEGGIQRVRYTGNEFKMLTHWEVQKDGILIKFNFDLPPSINADAFKLTQWNYQWSTNYGSKQYIPGTDKIGTEKVRISVIHINPDWRTVKLVIPGIKPVHQIHAKLSIPGKDGLFKEEMWMTINKIP